MFVFVKLKLNCSQIWFFTDYGVLGGPRERGQQIQIGRCACWAKGKTRHMAQCSKEQTFFSLGKALIEHPPLCSGGSVSPVGYGEGTLEGLQATGGQAAVHVW